jgi:alkyl sulfatase BDS1-like metallo-beta-lactamase superfamily hydrolase
MIGRAPGHEVRTLKATALRALGDAQVNVNWRNFELTAAKELALGGVRVDGGLSALSTFFGYFDRPTGKPAPLAAR